MISARFTISRPLPSVTPLPLADIFVKYVIYGNVNLVRKGGFSNTSIYAPRHSKLLNLLHD
jgi:hypothetical protein